MFAQAEKLFEQMEQVAIDAARTGIAVELETLNEMFPRHTFSYEGRQCLDYVKVTPSIFGETNLQPWTFEGPYDFDRRVSRFDAIRNMADYLQRITDIHTELTDITRRNTEVGEVF